MEPKIIRGAPGQGSNKGSHKHRSLEEESMTLIQTNPRAVVLGHRLQRTGQYPSAAPPG